MSRKEKQETQVIAGRHPVREALERRPQEIDKILLQRGVSGEGIGAIRSAASQAGVPMQYVPRPRLDALTEGANHQGVAAVASVIAYRDLDGMLSSIAPMWEDVKDRKPLLLVLDRITDPQNFGAMLRSAVAASVAGVIVPDSHMAPLSTATVKASAGTADRVPIARVSDLRQALQQLKERGYWIAGADGDGEESAWDMDWDRALALVIGSEGRGLRQEVAEACDFRVAIPMPGPAESLNASVAAGILLFQAARARQEQGAS